MNTATIQVKDSINRIGQIDKCLFNVGRYQRWHPIHILTNHLTGAQSPDRKKMGRAYTWNESCSAPLFICYEKTGHLFIFLLIFLRVLFFRASCHMPGRHLSGHNMWCALELVVLISGESCSRGKGGQSSFRKCIHRTVLHQCLC